MDQLAVTSSVHPIGCVLRKENGHVLRNAFEYEVDGQRKKMSLEWAWKESVEEEVMMVGVGREDALYRSKRIVGVNHIAIRLWLIWPPSHIVGDITGFIALVSSS